MSRYLCANVLGAGAWAVGSTVATLGLRTAVLAYPLEATALGVGFAEAGMAAGADAASPSSFIGLRPTAQSVLKAGQAFEADVLAAQSLVKNTGVWRPTANQIDGATFKLIVGDARYTSSGLARGTTLDSVQGGFLEIKGGSSVLDSTYQLRLQTYRSLMESTPLTIQTTRPVDINFGQWLNRWGVSIQAPPAVR